MPDMDPMGYNLYKWLNPFFIRPAPQETKLAPENMSSPKKSSSSTIALQVLG